MIKVLKNGFEFLKQFLLFFLIFAISLIIFSIISATLENAHGAEYDYIKIPQLALVNTQNIYLKEIAEIHIKDKDKKLYVSNMVLGASPIPGKWRFFKGDWIKNFLNARLGESIRLIVPERVKVVSKVRYISAEEIRDELVKFIENTEIWTEIIAKGNKLILKNFNMESISVPDRKVDLIFNVTKGDNLLGTSNIEMKILDGNLLFKKMWIRVNISFAGHIVVAKRDLRSGEIIEESMLERKEIEIENSPSKFFTDQNDILGKRVKGFIRKGFAIMEALIESPPLVNFGDMIKIFAENEFIHLSSNGVALGRGGLGSIINVRNVKTNKVVSAEIIGERIVRVTF